MTELEKSEVRGRILKYLSQENLELVEEIDFDAEFQFVEMGVRDISSGQSFPLVVFFTKVWEIFP